jgi:hypothetical protein
MKTIKKKKRKIYPTKLRVVIFKATHSEYKRMKALAKKETKGNLSLLIRQRLLSKKAS